MNIAVCDAHLELKGFLRMDGAWIGSIDIAQKKARTARDFNMDTRDIGPLCQPGQPLYCIEHSNKGLITFGGGVILKVPPPRPPPVASPPSTLPPGALPSAESARRALPLSRQSPRVAPERRRHGHRRDRRLGWLRRAGPRRRRRGRPVRSKMSAAVSIACRAKAAARHGTNPRASTAPP